jgi:hypothetical protein
MNINNRNYNYYYYLTEELKEQNSLKIKTIDENNTIKEKSIVIFK